MHGRVPIVVAVAVAAAVAVAGVVVAPPAVIAAPTADLPPTPLAAAIAESRRRTIEGEIERLQQRIGRLTIAVRDARAQLYVDDVAIGLAARAEALPVNVGRRKVEVVSPAGERQVRFVDVPGGETVHVDARFDRSLS